MFLLFKKALWIAGSILMSIPLFSESVWFLSSIFAETQLLNGCPTTVFRMVIYQSLGTCLMSLSSGKYSATFEIPKQCSLMTSMPMPSYKGIFIGLAYSFVISK